MKKKIAGLALMLTLVCCSLPVGAAGVQNQEVKQEVVDRVGEGEDVYSVTVLFDANGGQNTMPVVTVASNVQTRLTPNTLVRKGFQFMGWNTQANGKGTAYADQADVTQLANVASNGQSIVLYAQWKINAPKINKVQLSTPVSLKVSYKKDSNAGGYEIQYAVKSNFKSAKKITAKKSESSKVFDIIPGKTWYARMRSYYTNNGVKSYSDWSSSKKIKVKNASTISNTKSQATIEADITLKGSGTGYHGKLVICTPTSAVSFGIQYDAHAAAPYTGKAMALIENVASNDAGGQQYTRPGNKSLKLGKKYHMMLTIDKKGNGSVYLDYKKIGSFSNRGLANQQLYLRVEGSARLNGDGVNATFQNVKCKTGGKYDPNKAWGTHEFKTNPTLKNKIKKDGTITISGKVTGLPAGGDWDNQYGSVSDIIQFVE